MFTDRKFGFASLIVILLAACPILAFPGSGSGSRRSSPYVISASQWGPGQKEYSSARQRVLRSSEVRDSIATSNFRLLELRAIDRADAKKNSLPPTHFRAFIYDYDTARTFAAEGDFAGKEAIRVYLSPIVPDVSPTQEELQQAFSIVGSDPVLGPGVKSGRIELFAPMPPLTFLEGERIVNVGIRDSAAGRDKIVGVSFKEKKAVDLGENEPHANVTGANCGIANAGQGSSTTGLGTLQLSTSINNQTIWEMIVVRPSMSSGRLGEGSGIEVRDVKYKGKSVLKRGHAPILNVKYHPGGCGSFRDWQNAEGFFLAPAAGANEPLAGYRILADGQVAQTAVESGTDTGDFQGVAIYQQDIGFGIELVLVTEMNAGWYRYIMEWRFAADGTIRPRYGFGSVSNNCVCAKRDHHVYWRFDFDVVNPENKVSRVERGRRFLTPITMESKIFRSYQTNKALLIQNSSGDEAYELVPNITDEEAYFKYENGGTETFGAGDLWVLRFAGTASVPGELDDPNTTNAANLDPWVSGQAIGNNDVVVWYGAHQFRSDGSSLTNFDRSGLVLNGVHTVGPDLRSVRW